MIKRVLFTAKFSGNAWKENRRKWKQQQQQQHQQNKTSPYMYDRYGCEKSAPYIELKIYYLNNRVCKYVRVSGYAFHHALRCWAKTWQEVGVGEHLTEATPSNIKGCPEVKRSSFQPNRVEKTPQQSIIHCWWSQRSIRGQLDTTWDQIA